MKSIFTLICLTMASSVMSSVISDDLAGEYNLISAKGEGAQYHCAEKINVTVSSYGVFLESSTHGSLEQFRAENEGCKRTKGDIGPLRTSCTEFGKSRVSYSLTEPITIVGYVREHTTVSLKDTVLTYQHNVTEFPFGILGIWDSEEFKCDYQRSN